MKIRVISHGKFHIFLDDHESVEIDRRCAKRPVGSELAADFARRLKRRLDARYPAPARLFSNPEPLEARWYLS